MNNNIITHQPLSPSQESALNALLEINSLYHAFTTQITFPPCLDLSIDQLFYDSHGRVTDAVCNYILTKLNITINSEIGDEAFGYILANITIGDDDDLFTLAECVIRNLTEIYSNK